MGVLRVTAGHHGTRPAVGADHDDLDRLQAVDGEAVAAAQRTVAAPGTCPPMPTRALSPAGMVTPHRRWSVRQASASRTPGSIITALRSGSYAIARISPRSTTTCTSASPATFSKL